MCNHVNWNPTYNSSGFECKDCNEFTRLFCKKCGYPRWDEGAFLWGSPPCPTCNGNNITAKELIRLRSKIFELESKMVSCGQLLIKL